MPSGLINTYRLSWGSLCHHQEKLLLLLHPSQTNISVSTNEKTKQTQTILYNVQILSLKCYRKKADRSVVIRSANYILDDVISPYLEKVEVREKESDRGASSQPTVN
jgi:hypothetical protein